MISLHSEMGVLRLRLRSIVEAGELRDARLRGLRCLDEAPVEAFVIDIRGCKAVDGECLETLRGFYGEVLHRGVEKFVRIGEGTLLAMQLEALEHEVDVGGRTVVCRGDGDERP